MELSRQSARRVNTPGRQLTDRVLDRIEAGRGKDIDLTGNTVDPAVFEARALQASSDKMMAVMGKEALQYSASHDYMPLKEKIAQRYRLCGLDAKADQLTITNGSTQAVDLICKVLVNDGDSVLVDVPLQPRVIQAISMYEPQVCEVPVTPDGPDPDLLEDRLRQSGARVYFSAPTAQEMGGVVWSRQKREKVASLMRSYDCVLIELDRCGDLMNPQDRPEYLSQLLGKQAVLIGSFSPVLGPGLRIGWIRAADPKLSGYCTEAKQKTDSHANGYIQRVLWQYLEDCDFASHAAQVSALYDRRRREALAVLEECGLSQHLFFIPRAGTTLYLKTTGEKSDVQVFEEAAEKGVLVLPGSLCSSSGCTAGSVGIDFAGADERALRSAFYVLREVL